MSNRRTPAWERLMESKGLGSYRRLADRAGISHEAVRRVVLGQPAAPDSIRAVAAALSIDEELVREMRGEVSFDPRAWEPPESSRMLTDDERAALSRLIGVMTTGRTGEDQTDDTSPMNQAGVSPADSGETLISEYQGVIRPPRWSPKVQDVLDMSEAERGEWAAEDEAAHPMPEGGTEYQKRAREQDEAAEGSQDDGGDEPA